MKKVLSSLLVESHFVTPRQHIDWMFVLSWAGVAISLSILLVVLAVR
jgi:hypothetical protein